MKNFIKLVFGLVVLVFLVIDFAGLWKYKLSGKNYVLASGEESDAILDSEEDVGVNQIEYINLESTTMKPDEVLFIKNINVTDDEEKYLIEGTIYTPYEISKYNYTALRSGESVEILGSTYTMSQIKSNNLVLKSSDSKAKGYNISYDTTNKKYVLKEKIGNRVVYKSTEEYVRLEVPKGTAFSIEKDGKTENKKIEDVVDTHKDVKEPDGETASLDRCTVTFNSDGVCTKIVKTSK